MDSLLRSSPLSRIKDTTIALLLSMTIFPSLYLWISNFLFPNSVFWDISNYILLAGLAVTLAVSVYPRFEISHYGAFTSILFALFISYTAVTLLWSSDIGYGFYKVIRLCSVIAIGFFLVLLNTSKSRAQTLRLYIVFAVLGLILGLFTSLVSGFSAVTYGTGDLEYILSSRFSGMATLVFTSVAVFYSDTVDGKWTLFAWILAGFSVIPLILIGSRAPFISTILSLFTIFVLYLLIRIQPNTSSRLLRFVVTTVAALGMIFLLQFGGGFRLRTLSRLSGSVLEPGSSLFTRLELYQLAIVEWSRSPIFGLGIGSFPTVSSYAYPHNILFELLVETGIIGVVLFLLLAVFSSQLIIRDYMSNESPLSLLTFGLIVYWSLNALFSGDITDNRMLFLLFGFVGFISNYNRNHSK